MPLSIFIPKEAAGQRLTAYLSSQNVPVSADCGGRGVCGKCRVRVLEGTFTQDAALTEPLPADASGCVLACRAFCPPEGARIELPDTDGDGLTEFTHHQPEHTTIARAGYGVALDLGTTTLAASLVDLSSGETLASVSRLNPQRSFGADVMSRITASCEHLAAMQEVILSAVREMTASLVQTHPDCIPNALTVVGNPTMLHLFAGVDPSPMGAYPFTPAFTKEKILPGKELSLPFETITLLPSASAFIGSDVTAGAAICGMRAQSGPSLLIDVGTNGEMLLCLGKDRGGALSAASAAAGPAMEGAGISCGVGGIPGAICSVQAENQGISFETVGGKGPVGLCGSGLIDLIAVLLEKKLLDDTGYLEDDPFELFSDPARIFGEISLTQRDVRQFQLAKSAIRAGIEALLADAGIRAEDVENVYIAGGLGYYMNIRSAVAGGLLPACFASTATAIGNSALAGAVRALVSPEFRAEVAAIAEECRVIELNDSDVFNEGFIEYMAFPEKD